ncbi:hypothetical protein JDV02_003610 [Purpureocillium takamizusanense]|uniref:Uncharacterized protein n=1 Tax=Purpureocillium takamizusanense TaxID=2060973 RepID=A0A9Q8QE55_9HYPO|nr:uncharacterized protein JDV02_003610 [Purpureocillium takamizusanense]UNI17251.1 hypothetical protein JDV02_003610 [Purpureocillium takamizusanense]
MVPLMDQVAGHLARDEGLTTPKFTGFPAWTLGDESEDEAGAEGPQARHKKGKRRAIERRSSLPPSAADSALRLGSPHRRSSSKRGLLRNVVEPIVSKLGGDKSEPESSDHDKSSPESEPPTPTASSAPTANPPPSLPPPPTSLPSPSNRPQSKFFTPQVTSTSYRTKESARPSNALPVNNADDKSSQYVTSMAATQSYYSPSATSMLESVTSISTSSAAPITTKPDKIEDHPSHAHDNLHASTEKALIAVGSIGATIIVFFVVWVSWKCFKMRRGKKHSDNWLPATFSLERSKQIAVNLASRVPVLKDKVAKRTWSNLEKPYDEAYWEKQLPYSGATTGNPGGITVHTAIVRESVVDDNPGAAGLSRHGPSQSMSSTQPQFNNTLRSNYQVANGRMSEISSLSSGFGDGDIIMPPPNSKTTVTAARLPVPPPAATRSSVSEMSQRRETTYTEASEDPVPRFRSINSWVRQQTGRVKRAKQREVAASDAPPVPNMPPEQDFKLMMPDGEEPRRAQMEASQRDGREDASEP